MIMQAEVDTRILCKQTYLLCGASMRTQFPFS